MGGGILSSAYSELKKAFKRLNLNDSRPPVSKYETQEFMVYLAVLFYSSAIYAYYLNLPIDGIMFAIIGALFSWFAIKAPRLKDVTPIKNPKPKKKRL